MELWDDYENTVTEAVMEDRKRPGTNWRVPDMFTFFTADARRKGVIETDDYHAVFKNSHQLGGPNLIITVDHDQMKVRMDLVEE